MYPAPSPAFVNQVLLGHSHTHSFTCLWLLWFYDGRTEGSCEGTLWPAELRILTFGSLRLAGPHQTGPYSQSVAELVGMKTNFQGISPAARCWDR